MTAKRLAVAFPLLIICLLSQKAFGYEGGEYRSMTGTANTSASATTAQATVELFSGAFTTSIDIATPPGRRNIQPDLKLVYNSRSGSSWCGLGWSLPLASITRSFRFGIPSYGTSDEFHVSGQELVLVDGSTYRLRHESSFMKFQKDSTANRWVATDLNGTKYYFGSSPNVNLTGRIGTNPSTFNGTFQWYLIEVVDIFGNYMTIEYEKPSGTEGYYYPKYIKYTGHHNDDSPSLSSQYEVSFTTTTRSDIIPAYTAGFLVEVGKLLSTIVIKYNGNEIRTYTFSYETSPNSGYSRLTQVQVSAPSTTALPPTRFTYYDTTSSEKGFEEASTAYHLPVEIGNYAYSGTREDHGTRFVDLNGDGFIDIIQALVTMEGDTIESWDVEVYRNTGMIDSNTLWVRWTAWEDAFNDLKDEVMDDYGFPLSFTKHQSDRIGLCGAINDGCGPYYTCKKWRINPLQILDVNSDGKPDLLFSQSRSLCWGGAGVEHIQKVFLNISSGSTVGWQESDWSLPYSFGWYHGGQTGFNFGDVNADGFLDMIVLSADDGNSVREYYINPGDDGDWEPDDGYTVPTHLFEYNHWQNGQRLFDINGDGLPDFDFSRVDAKVPQLSNGQKGLVDASTPWDAPVAFNKDPEYTMDLGVRFMDINGDHLLDMLQLYDPPSSGLLENAYIFQADGSSSKWEDQSSSYASSLPGSTLLFMQGFYIGSGGNADRGARTVDVNGDGLTDLVLGNQHNNTFHTYLNKASLQTDLLIKIDNSQGVVTEINYASSHDPAFLDSTACANDTNRLANPMAVVESTVTKVFDGSTYGNLKTKAEYTYCGGYLYGGSTLVARGGATVVDAKTEFRGFGHVESVNYYYESSAWQAKSRGETRFNQDIGKFEGNFVGTISGQTVYHGSTVLSETLNSYTVNDIFSGDTVIYYSYPTQQQSSLYDGGTITTESHTEYTFDTTHAMIEKMRSIQDGEVNVSGDEKYTETVYSYNFTNWIQKIQKTWMTTQSGWAENSRLSEKRFLYDGNTTPGTVSTRGLLTGVSELLTDVNPGTTLPGTFSYIPTWAIDGTTADAYDDYGNLLTWSDFGVHKSFSYESTTKTYPEIATTGVGSLNHKVKTRYNFSFGTAYYSQGPYPGSTVVGVSTWTQFDPYGRVTKTRIAPADGSSVDVSEYTYTVRTCASTGCTSAKWPPVIISKKVYDGDTVGNNSTILSVSIYDAAGRVIQEKAEAAMLNGATYQKVADTEYDVQGRKSEESEPYFVRITEGNTAWLNPSTYRGSTVGKTAYTYDDRDRMTQTQLLYGNTTITLAQVSYDVDSHYLWKTVTDADSKVTRSCQDVFGRVEETVQVLGEDREVTTYFTYDGLDNLIETDVLGGNTLDPAITVTYDSLSRKTAMSDPDMGDWQYTYDTRGNLECQIDVGGKTGDADDTVKTCYNYDPINRIKRKYYRDHDNNIIDSDYLYFHDRSSNYETNWSHVWYVYDVYDSNTCEPDGSMTIPHEAMGLGKLTAVCNLNDGDDDLKYIYSYDHYGRKIREWDAWDDYSSSMGFGYDRLDRNTRLVYYLSGETAQRMSYHYNNGGELNKVDDTDLNVYARWGSTTERGYNARGQELKLRYGNGTANTWSYLPGTGKLNGLLTDGPGSGNTLQDYSYQIDNVGNITAITNNLPGETVYYFGNITASYDNLHRLTQTTIAGRLSSATFNHTYNYAYSPNGNITSKTNYLQGVGTAAVAMSYSTSPSTHQAVSGVISGGTLFATVYDANGNITRKRRYDRGDGVSYYHHRLYNTENKMVQVLNVNGETVTRQSDQFYHLDGSRLWEGIMDENNTVIEGEMRFNDFVSVRLTSDGLAYLVMNIYANGRRISQGELAIWDSEWGCNLSPAGKLRFVTFSTLAVNFGLLILPVFLAILIRGLFFDKSWRNKRSRNTFILLLVLVFTLEVNPIPNLNLGAVQAAQSEIRLWFMAHVRDRLNRMYGDADRVPLMDHRLTVIGHPDLVPPSSGEAPLRGAMLYFLPPELKKRVEGVWHTTAKADMNNDAIEKVWHTTARADLRRGAELGGTGFGGTDIPVGQTTSNLKPQTSNLDFSGASDVSRDGLFSTLAQAFLPSEAHAWSGGAAELDRLHFFHTDHLGSTRIVTDCAGALYERIDYLPFGEVFRDDVSSGPDTNYDRHRNKYTGQTWDYLTGLYYYGARYYDPEMGRFSQADTMVPKPLNSQTFNRYSYVNNNPYKYVDPSGHNALESFLIGLVEAVVVALAFIINPTLGAIVSGAISAMHASLAGASGGALVGAFFQGMVMAGMAAASRTIGAIMSAYGIYQAVASNRPEAMAACFGGLLGGYFVQRAKEAANGGEVSRTTQSTEDNAIKIPPAAVQSSQDSEAEATARFVEDVFRNRWEMHKYHTRILPVPKSWVKWHEKYDVYRCNLLAIDALLAGNADPNDVKLGDGSYMTVQTLHNRITMNGSRWQQHSQPKRGDLIIWYRSGKPGEPGVHHSAIAISDTMCIYAGSPEAPGIQRLEISEMTTIMGVPPIFARPPVRLP